MSSSPPPAACAASMNAYCNHDPAMASCVAAIKSANGTVPLVALDDTNAQGAAAHWRCYSPTCLDASGTQYKKGSGCTLYCTHEAELEQKLTECTTTRLFVDGDNATSCFRIPNILDADGKGTALLAFTEARRKSCSDSGPKSLAMRKSIDGGASWQPTKFLVSDPDAQSDGLNLGASVRDAQTGSIFVHYGVCAHACRPAGTTFVLASRDEGESWTTQNITHVVVAAGWGMINAGPGTGVTLAAGSPHAGRLAVAVWGRRLSSSDIRGGVATLFSDDHGASWSLGAPVLADATFEPNECQLAQLPNGSLLMNVRDGNAGSGCHCRLMTISHDGGANWSPFRRESQLTGPVCQGSMIAAGDALFYSAPQSLEAREDGYVKASVDGGQTWWLRGGRLDSAADPGFGYSGLVALGAGARAGSTRLGVVYEPHEGGVTFKAVDV